MEVVFFVNAGSSRWMDMLKGYGKMMDEPKAFADRFAKEDKEESDEQDADNSYNDVSGLVQSTIDLSVQDGDINYETGEDNDTTEGGAAAIEGLFELTNASDDELEGREGPEDEPEDATKGVPGFSWLEGIELWARLE
jgi:hypothetical protein